MRHWNSQAAMKGMLGSKNTNLGGVQNNVIIKPLLSPLIMTQKSDWGDYCGPWIPISSYSIIIHYITDETLEQRSCYEKGVIFVDNQFQFQSQPSIIIYFTTDETMEQSSYYEWDFRVQKHTILVLKMMLYWWDNGTVKLLWMGF